MAHSRTKSVTSPSLPFVSRYKSVKHICPHGPKQLHAMAISTSSGSASSEPTVSIYFKLQKNKGSDFCCRIMMSDFEKRLLGGDVRNVLFTCEGDFSLSVAFVRRLNAEKVKHPMLVTTTLESKSVALAGFARARDNIAELKQNAVKTKFNFDAHAISESLKTSGIKARNFCRVVSTFPCIGNSTFNLNIAMRVWLKCFLQSAQAVLRKNTGQIWLTLLDGQAEHHRWQLKEQLVATGLNLQQKLSFPWSKLPGYECRRGANWDAPFPRHYAITFIITRLQSTGSPSRLTTIPVKRSSSGEQRSLALATPQKCKVESQAEMDHSYKFKSEDQNVSSSKIDCSQKSRDLIANEPTKIHSIDNANRLSGYCAAINIKAPSGNKSVENGYDTSGETIVQRGTDYLDSNLSVEEVIRPPLKRKKAGTDAKALVSKDKTDKSDRLKPSRSAK